MSFSFGAPSSAPATSAVASGFSFGANKPATPGFGLGTSQASTGLFGSPATSTPSFGAAAPFGGITATPAFGSTTSAAPAFGATTAPTFGAASTAPAFGATSTAPAFGATSTAPSFGTGTGLGGGLNFGAGTSTAATGLSFGAPIKTSTGLCGFSGFGTTTTASQQPGFGLFNTSSTANTSGLFASTAPKLGTTLGTQPSTSVAPSLGLGGISTTSGIGAANTTTGDGKNEPPKQTKLPNEITTTLDSFKDFMRKQKSLSSEIMRVSIKPLHKVTQEVEELCSQVVSLSGEVCRGRAAARRLRAAAAAAAQAADIAHSNNNNGTQLECSAPPQFVKDLLSELEQQLVTFRRQMDAADRQMQTEPKLLSEHELTLGIRRMHESLVALAGRLQAVHTQVEAQKEQYLNLRRYVLKDPSDVFESTAQTGLDQILREAEGHRKKAKLPTDFNASAVLQDPKAALGNIQQLAGPTPFTYFGSTLSPYPTADTSVGSTSSWAPPAAAPSLDTSSFQLQKPPGKRGKP